MKRQKKGILKARLNNTSDEAAQEKKVCSSFNRSLVPIHQKPSDLQDGE